MAGRENTAHHLDRSGREVDVIRTEFLNHLCHVSMTGRLVRAHRAAALGVMARIARRIAAFARAGLDLHHCALGEPAPVEWTQCKYGRGRVASGARDELGAGKLVPMQLRHSIDKSTEQVGTRMLAAVPAHVAGRVAQPEIRAQIDDPGREGTELVDSRHRLSVGQTQKQRVAGFELGCGGELQPRRRTQVRVCVVHELPGQTLRRRLAHLDARMEQQQPQQLASRVSGRAGNRDADHLPPSTRYSTIRPGMLTPVVSMLFLNSIV